MERCSGCSICLGSRYTGTAAFDCELAFDKVLAKDVLRRAGVPTPDWVVIEGSALRDLGAGAALPAALERIGLPCIVKPSRSGSALGVSAVERESRPRRRGDGRAVVQRRRRSWSG